jgi:hypothetical protein
VARYRTKDETDLVWNRIRRKITRDIDYQLMNVREEMLNVALSAAWGDFTEAIGTGKLIEIEDRYSTYVEGIVKDALEKRPIDAGVAAG